MITANDRKILAMTDAQRERLKYLVHRHDLPTAIRMVLKEQK